MQRRTVAAAIALGGSLIVGACSASSTTVEPTTPTAASTITSASVTTAAGSSTGSTTTTPSAPPATAAPPTTTAGAPIPCTPGAAYPVGTTRHTMVVDGETRELLVRIPPRPRAGMHLVVDFHGAGSNMQQQSLYSGFNALADRDSFVVATPNGVDAAIRQWRFLDPKDIDFAKAIVAELVANACVSPQLTAATGISSGGAMTASLACRAADVFRAFAPVAADFYNEAYCGAAPARPFMIFHGTADKIVPYGGGGVTAPSNRGTLVKPAEETAAQRAEHNGCTSGPTTTQQSSEVVRLDWSGCKQPVVMYKIIGGGHTWPGAVVDVPRLGMTTRQISAAQTMWDFFQQHA